MVSEKVVNIFCRRMKGSKIFLASINITEKKLVALTAKATKRLWVTVNLVYLKNVGF